MRSEVQSAPQGWRGAPLYDLATYQNGRAFRPSEVGDEGLPVIKIAELKRGITDATKRYAGDVDRKHEIDEGDLLFAWSGSPGIYRYPGPRGALNQHIFKVTAAPEVDQGFLRWLLAGQMPVFERVVADQATTMGHVKVADLKRLTARVPDFKEQRRIAWVLGSLDDKIELNRRITETLEQIAGAIFKARFADFVGVETFEESEIGPIPKGWRVGKVSDLCARVGNGGTPKRMEPRYWEGGNIPWFKTGELTDGLLPSSSEEQITQVGLDESSCKLFPAGTVLIAIYAAPTVGRLGVLSEAGTSNQACTALEPQDDVGTWFVFYTLRHLRDYYNGISSGSAQQNISKKIVESAPCVIAPPNELTRFEQVAAPIAKQVTALNLENASLAVLRDTLLPKLISGEIRVPEGFGPDSDLGHLLADNAPDPTPASGKDRTATSSPPAA